MNAAAFEEWVETCSADTFESDIVVWTISRATRVEVEQIIKAAGAELRYLPPTARHEPIEKAYSKLKPICAKSPETIAASSPLSKPALKSSNRRMSKLFKACGYDTD